MPPEEYEKKYEEVVSKECLCIGLMNSAIQTYDLPPVKKLQAVTICPGPNIAYFSKIVSLQEIIDHIYGRKSMLSNVTRPHMFIKELILNIDYLREQISDLTVRNDRALRDISSFGNQLLAGIKYYRDLSGKIIRSGGQIFLDQLDECELGVRSLLEESVMVSPNL